MAEMLFKTKGNGSPSGKARVYFTCHSDDFGLYFEQVCEYIFKSHDCAVYYTADMNETINDEDKVTDLESNNLFVVPVTFKLLGTPNRAMDDVRFALEKHIPVLPLMMESGLDTIYSRPDKFGELQYLSPFSSDVTEVSFEEKLKKYLESVLVSDEMAKRVRAAFDAYIFLSYRKKDRKYANQLMRIIHNKPECRDIAIWYDEFLTPGESFRENIDKILADSKLFTLLVTPNLLEENNFVMEKEYPAAVKSGIEILPAEMEETDKNILAEKYANLPEISNPYDDESFRNRLADTLSNLAIKSNDTDPEHNFLIGLAYLDGIDVEVDRERALELITKAADAELPEAMAKLYKMYYHGVGVKLDYYKAAYLAEKLYNYSNTVGDAHTRILSAQVSADAYLKCGEYEKSYELYEKARVLSIELLGTEHEDTLRLLNNLAVLYPRLGYHHKALELLEWLYPLNCKIYGDNHLSTLTSRVNLASVYASTNNIEKAIELCEKACHSQLEILGDKHPDTLMSLSNLASYYSTTGNHSKAIELGENVYQLKTEVLGEKHPDTLTSLNVLTVCYRSAGNHKKAIELGEKAYYSRLEVLGEKHPDTLTSLETLITCYHSAGNRTKLVELGEKVYYSRLEILGEKHPDTLTSLNNLSNYYNSNRNYEKAIELGEKAYHTRLEVLGENHNDTLISLNNLAFFHYSNKNNKKAAELYEKAYNISIEVLGEKHPKTMTSLSNLTICSYFPGNRAKAIMFTEKLYQLKSEALGEKHPDTIKVLSRLASCYHSANDSDKAIVLGEKAFNLKLEVFGRKHSDTLEYIPKLISYYDAIKNDDDKTKFAQKLYTLTLAVHGDNLSGALSTLKSLAYQYTSNGNHFKAIALLEKVYQLSIEVHGESHPDTLEFLNILEHYHSSLGEKRHNTIQAKENYQNCSHDYNTENKKSVNIWSSISLFFLKIRCKTEKSLEKRLYLTSDMYRISYESFGEDDPRTITFLIRRGEAYKNLNMLPDAIKCFEKAYNARLETLGADHEDTITVKKLLDEIK